MENQASRTYHFSHPHSLIYGIKAFGEREDTRAAAQDTCENLPVSKTLVIWGFKNKLKKFTIER